MREDKKNNKLKNVFSNQKGMALITTLIFVFILVTFAVALLTMTSNDSKLSTLQRESTRAFYLAETGIEKSIWYLNSSEDNPDGLYFVGSLHGGEVTTEFYDVDISEIDTTGPDEIKTIISTGKVVGGGEYNKGTRKIEVKVTKGIKQSPNLTYDYAVLTDGDMEIDGGVTFHGNIHSNKDLTNNGTINMEYGSATATGNTNYGTGNQPYQEFPHIYWEYYEDISMTQEMIEGNTYNNHYSGDVTFDSPDTLYGVHFIEGNVTIKTDLILHDAAIFATGYIEVKGGIGDVTLDNADNPNPLSLIAKGYIKISGSVHGEGIIQTESDFRLDGNVNIQKGAIYADDGVFHGGGGSMNVYYDTDYTDIVVPGTGIPVWVKISWQEVY
ncbi:MAG: pilus assembly PilX N-terminal domain-containing protein [Candidatus Atribacteria bacterium]|nr:pilus assembly PilX N-terminal domain-containing protein [Candidatus Atribacteria bacterium]